MSRSTYSLNQHSPASLRALQGLKTKGTVDQNELNQKELGGTKSLLVLLALVLAIPILMIIRLDPRVDRWMSNHGKPTLAMGTVQSIQYVGRLGGLDTQINTDQQALLVEGTAALRNGTALEWRRSELNGDLCVMETNRCWNLLIADELERTANATTLHPTPQ